MNLPPYINTINQPNERVNLIFDAPTGNCLDLCYSGLNSLPGLLAHYNVELPCVYDNPGLYVVEPTVINNLLKLHKHIPDRIADRIRNNDIRLIILWARESIPYHMNIPILEQMETNLNIEKSMYTFVSGNMTQNDASGYNKHGIRHVAYFMFDCIMAAQPKCKLPDCTKTKIKKFLSYNGALKPHRTMLYHLLSDADLLESSYVSYLKNTYGVEIDGIGYYDNLTDTCKDALNAIAHSPPVCVDLSVDEYCTNFYNDDLALYENTYFSLVTESSVEKDNLFITEKTFKAIANNHPYMIFGNPGTLSMLESLGYDNYTCIFDCSYDAMPNEINRLTAIVNQISNNNFDNKYNNKIVDIAKHNRNILYDTNYNKRLQELLMHV